ncbi:MAG TPA: phosphotransferase [Candidatus Limnocylindria bacterium]|nr:phosphotransferase [Candidatus Limnocylindria bacterium]
MLRPWTDVELAELVAAAGLTGVPEEPMPTDGWSGATFSRLRRADGARFVLKRDAYAANWIVRATADVELREAVFAATVGAGGIEAPRSIHLPYLGAARDGEGAAILMPDLSGELIAWEDRRPAVALDRAALTTVLDAIAGLHATPDALRPTGNVPGAGPLCPLRERLLLLSRPSAMRYADEGTWVGARFLAGWDAFDRRASALARRLIESLSDDPAPLIAALGRMPSAGLHGDLKLSNVGLLPGRRVALIDWQMTLRAPIAVEVGWFLVSNVAILPLAPLAVLDAYRDAVRRRVGRGGRAHPRGLDRPDQDEIIGDWEAQADLAWIVGLLLRGWRKGPDAEAGVAHPSGVSAVDDLAWWCAMAVQAAERRL